MTPSRLNASVSPVSPNRAESILVKSSSVGIVNPMAAITSPWGFFTGLLSITVN